MKIKILAGAIGIGVVAYLGSVYLVGQSDKALAEQQLAEFEHLDKSSLDYQAMKLLTDKGCGYCHTPNSDMPFYSQLPIAKQLMQTDVRVAMRHFDMRVLLDDIKQDDPVSEVALARLEKVLNDDSMPPALYLSMHWSASMSDDDKTVLREWVSEKRTERHANSPVPEERKSKVLQPIYTQFETDADKVALGNVLYHDVRLSGDNSVSCASCHGLDTGGVDRMVGSVGIHGQVGGINAPTVFNAVYNRVQFWDGRAADLQEQAGGPPFNPIEMGSNDWQEIIDKLNEDSEIVAMFKHAYDGEMTGDTITHAIAQFEKTLVTPNSRFDQYMMGDDDAMSEHEKHGLALFKKYDCQTCHAGEALGGETFETMGMKGDYFAYRGTDVTEADFGRYNFTQNEEDMHKFKVPTLRNIELTEPYFHDGYADTLEKAIFYMGKYQVGVELSDSEVEAVKAFLMTLTGEYEGVPLS
ncbi:cytochrome c peroxidase [Vibrio astriarenae]|uniref:cytochrome c peroxidase n=1 Tax=Vibrio astriarenae TaxID=1481923 RepID=UPI0037357E6D